MRSAIVVNAHCCRQSKDPTASNLNEPTDDGKKRTPPPRWNAPSLNAAVVCIHSSSGPWLGGPLACRLHHRLTLGNPLVSLAPTEPRVSVCDVILISVSLRSFVSERDEQRRLKRRRGNTTGWFLHDTLAAVIPSRSFMLTPVSFPLTGVAFLPWWTSRTNFTRSAFHWSLCKLHRMSALNMKPPTTENFSLLIFHLHRKISSSIELF